MIRLILIAGLVTRKPVSGVCSLATNSGMYTIVFGGRALERRSRNREDEIDRTSQRWLAQEKQMGKAESRCNHPFGNHQLS